MGDSFLLLLLKDSNIAPFAHYLLGNNFDNVLISFYKIPLLLLILLPNTKTLYFTISIGTLILLSNSEFISLLVLILFLLFHDVIYDSLIFRFIMKIILILIRIIILLHK